MVEADLPSLLEERVYTLNLNRLFSFSPFTLVRMSSNLLPLGTPKVAICQENCFKGDPVCALSCSVVFDSLQLHGL